MHHRSGAMSAGVRTPCIPPSQTMICSAHFRHLPHNKADGVKAFYDNNPTRINVSYAYPLRRYSGAINIPTAHLEFTGSKS